MLDSNRDSILNENVEIIGLGVMETMMMKVMVQSQGLGVHLRCSNKKTWMMGKKNLKYKVLLTLQDTCVHSVASVKVMLLPPNTTSLLQPLDQGIINTLKPCYTGIMYRRAVFVHKPA